jgi:vancomycin resistance protein YoaR
VNLHDNATCWATACATLYDVSRSRKIILWLVAAPLLIIALITVAWAADGWASSDKVARHVTLAGTPVGHESRDELDASVEQLAEELPSTTVEIDAGDFTLTTTAGELGLGVDQQRTVDRVMDIGRGDPLPVRPVRWIQSWFGERSADVVLTVDAEQLSTTLVALEGDRRTEPVEPSLNATVEAVSLVPGTPGQELTVNDVVAALPQSLGDIGTPITIDVELTTTDPQVSDEAVQALADQANQVTAGAITLNAGGAATEVDGPTFRPAFGIAIEDGTPRLTMQAEPVAKILDDEVPGKANPTGVRFDISGGVPTPVGGEDAQVCCTKDAPEKIVAALLAGQTTVDLPTRVETAAEGQQWAAGLGVKEVIGQFTTNHKCCESRVTNIHRIADILRGTLIPPGTTFSVNDTVGRRTTEKGFVEGGVIQDGEFSTDIGGGVSQFATTTFNAAFFGGLDIPAYKMHSKYISRYPFGREATLAYPGVDLKIRNDTPYGIVIWPSYTDTSITVQLWSTRTAVGEQTAQNPTSGCGPVTTERTRTFTDGHTEKDTFRANYDCD